MRRNQKEEYYGSATYSIAMLDMKNFMETLNMLETTLKDSKETVDIIVASRQIDQVKVSCITKYPLAEFCKAQRYLEHIRRTMPLYQKKLVQYFQENPDKSEEFNIKLVELNNLVKEKQRYLTEQIDKCFNCIKTFNDQNLVDN